MDQVVGIVSEFNPFHRGHAYLIDQVKSAHPHCTVVCVMSGNFVQRGSFAQSEKYSRAKCAVLGGADLVLEIPFPFSCLSAEAYASSAISILSRLGVCNLLAFGSEISELSVLKECASRLSSPEFSEKLKEYREEKKGRGYPFARAEVYRNLYGNCPVLDHPNASLAVEYLICNNALPAPFELYPVKRRVEGEENVSAPLASATACRKAATEGNWEELESRLPDFVWEELKREREAGRFPVSEEKLASVLFYLLRTKGAEELSRYYGMASVRDRLLRCADRCVSVEELVEKARSSTYTDSRIRRALLSLLLQIPYRIEKELPAYTQVLAANGAGRNLLGRIRKESAIPVFTKPSHPLNGEDVLIRRQASRAAIADRIYLSAFEAPHEEAYFLKKMPYLSEKC